jgi:hypothetical protein
MNFWSEVRKLRWGVKKLEQSLRIFLPQQGSTHERSSLIYFGTQRPCFEWVWFTNSGICSLFRNWNRVAIVGIEYEHAGMSQAKNHMMATCSTVFLEEKASLVVTMVGSRGLFRDTFGG